MKTNEFPPDVMIITLFFNIKNIGLHTKHMVLHIKRMVLFIKK